MAHKNLARFRLCAHPWCVKGAVTPRNRSKPNGWTRDSKGDLYCPAHTPDLHNTPAPTPTPTSYAPEVIADASGQWCGNALRFATREEAEKNVRDLSMRWVLVRETRVVESPDPVNYRWDDSTGLVAVAP